MSDAIGREFRYEDENVRIYHVELQTDTFSWRSHGHGHGETWPVHTVRHRSIVRTGALAGGWCVSFDCSSLTSCSFYRSHECALQCSLASQPCLNAHTREQDSCNEVVFFVLPYVVPSRMANASRETGVDRAEQIVLYCGARIAFQRSESQDKH